MNFEQARFNMIEQQVRPWDVLSQAVLDVMAEVHREDFVPSDKKDLAYSDMRLPLAYGQVMMPPTLEGRVLQDLSLKTSDEVLEVGTGSGYLTACLAKLVRKVVSIDIDENFIQDAQKMLAAKDIRNVTLETQDMYAMENDKRRFDAIVVTGSVEEIPDFLKAKLKINGRMFIITGSEKAPIMQANRVMRYGEEEFLTTPLFETWMPALINQPIKEHFQF